MQASARHRELRGTLSSVTTTIDLPLFGVLRYARTNGERGNATNHHHRAAGEHTDIRIPQTKWPVGRTTSKRNSECACTASLSLRRLRPRCSSPSASAAQLQGTSALTKRTSSTYGTKYSVHPRPS